MVALREHTNAMHVIDADACHRWLEGTSES